MHTRKLTLLLIGLFLIVLPASAQDSPDWFVYLFDSMNYDLIRVDANGNTDTFSLGIDSDSYLGFNQMAINRDGTLVAFCKETRADENSGLPGQKEVIVRDVASETDLLTLDYAAPYACSVSAFSDDGSQIAVSTVNELPYLSDAVDTPTPAWELHLVDIATGNIMHRISGDTVEMPETVFFGEDIPLVADVRIFSADTVRFAGMPYLAMDGPPEVPVYEWDLNSGSTTEMPPSTGRMNNDYLRPTGELAYAALDDRLAAAFPGGPILQANVVNIRDDAGNFITVYQNTEWVIAGTTFISDGQSLAISLLGAWDEDNPELSSVSRYEIVNRDGSIQELDATFEGYKEIAAVPGGAALTWTLNPTAESDGPTTVAFWDGTSLTTIAEFTPDYQMGFSPPMLIWSPAIGASAGSLKPFVAID